MAFLHLLLCAGMLSLPMCGAFFRGPLQPEMSNGTFHHYFVPDGDYEDNDDPEKCQMLFKMTDERKCGLDEDQDAVIRDDFTIIKRQIFFFIIIFSKIFLVLSQKQWRPL